MTLGIDKESESLRAKRFVLTTALRAFGVALARVRAMGFNPSIKIPVPTFSLPSTLPGDTDDADLHVALRQIADEASSWAGLQSDFHNGELIEILGAAAAVAYDHKDYPRNTISFTGHAALSGLLLGHAIEAAGLGALRQASARDRALLEKQTRGLQFGNRIKSSRKLLWQGRVTTWMTELADWSKSNVDLADEYKRANPQVRVPSASLPRFIATLRP